MGRKIIFIEKIFNRSNLFTY